MWFSNGMFEEFTVSIIITQDQGVKRTTMTCPRLMIEQQFLGLVQDVATRTEPFKVKLTRTAPVWSRFDQCYYDREYSIEYENDAYKAKYGTG